MRLRWTQESPSTNYLTEIPACETFDKDRLAMEGPTGRFIHSVSIVNRWCQADADGVLDGYELACANDRAWTNMPDAVHGVEVIMFCIQQT